MGHNGEGQNGNDIEDHYDNRRTESHTMTISKK